MDTPPKPFSAHAALVAGPSTIKQAAALTEALKAIPDFQAWLRKERQRIVLELHEDGMTYTDMAPKLGVKPERVSGIARGHSRSPRAKSAHSEGAAE